MALVLCVVFAAFFLCVPSLGWLRPEPKRSSVHFIRDGSLRHADGVPVSSPAATEHSVKRSRLSSTEHQLLQEFEGKGAFSPCWKEAVIKLRAACATELANEEKRTFLALHFTHCQLSLDGKPTSVVLDDCLTRKNMQECVNLLGEQLYPVYVQFWLHVDSLCFYIQEELFQQRTESAVRSLSTASRQAITTLADIALKSESANTAMTDLQEKHSAVATSMSTLEVSLAERLKQEEVFRSVVLTDMQKLSALSSSVEQVVSGQMEMMSLQEKLSFSVADYSEKHSAHLRDAHESTSRLLIEQQHAEKDAAVLKSLVEQISGNQDLSLQQAKSILEVLERIHQFSTGKLAAQLSLIENATESARALSLTSADQQLQLSLSTGEILAGLDRVRGVQERITSIFLNLETFGFYIALVAVVLIFTIPPRTNDARLTALMISAVACLLEVQLRRRTPSVLADLASSVSLFSSTGASSIEFLLLVHEGQWLLRRLAIGLLGCILVYSATRYQTPEDRHRAMLREELQRLLNLDEVKEATAAFQQLALQCDSNVERVEWQPLPAAANSSGLEEAVPSTRTSASKRSTSKRSAK